MRPSGRPHDSFRHLNFSFSGLDRADASARFGFGETKCIASLSGPIEVRLQAEQASRATLEVITRPLSGIAGTSEKLLANTIRSLLTPALVLSQHPRTLVQVCVQSLSPLGAGKDKKSSTSIASNPSLTAAAINSAGLALLNASSVPMRGVICALAVGIIRTADGQDDIILDPEESELPHLVGAGCFALLFGAGTSTGEMHVSLAEKAPKVDAEIIWSSWEGTFDAEEYARVERVAKVGAAQLWAAMRKACAEWNQSNAWHKPGQRVRGGDREGGKGGDRDRTPMQDRPNYVEAMDLD